MLSMNVITSQTSLLFRIIVTIALLLVSNAWQQHTVWRSSYVPVHNNKSNKNVINSQYERFYSNTMLKAETTSSTSFVDSSLSSTITTTLEQRKFELLQLGAMLDRGQAYNPTSGEYYKDRIDIAKEKLDQFIIAHPNNIPKSINEISGEWELILSTVTNGIFRSSPFFLAIQEAFELYSEEKEAFGSKKADLFFKLHELQTCSWGISKVGRVAQTITSNTTTSNDGKDIGSYLYSEFDTSLFSLTVIPIIGWFKLLPTFGGCVITAAKIIDLDQNNGLLKMRVDYTTSRKVNGLQGLGEWIWKIKVPVGFIWKNLLPWNKGRDADCKVYIRYVDNNFRIVQDVSGDYFVYTRPVVARPLDLALPSNDVF